MNKLKKVLSIASIVILLSLYIITLLSAIFTTKASSGLFMACIFATVTIPVFMYAVLLIAKVLKQNTENTNHAFDEKDSDKN